MARTLSEGVTIPARGATTRAPRALSRRPSYVAVTVLMTCIVGVGFWPTYFGPFVRGTLSQPLLIQVSLPESRYVRIH